MDKSEIREIVLDQNKSSQLRELVERDVHEDIENYFKNQFVIVISGIRRCGKSTIIGQIRAKRPGYYLNFDDERLINFKVSDFQPLCEIFMELYGDRNIFYFDEIQNILGWERFVRRLHDEGKKIFVTGSNATMLSRELGTHLTGRYLEIKLYPFSFNEFLKFKKIGIPKEIFQTSIKVLMKKSFDEYLIKGGFPEYLREYNGDYLKMLYENILYRDILIRYNLSGEKNLKDLVYTAVSNLSREISFNSIKKNLNISSTTTIKDYFEYLENGFLVFLVPKFDYSLKKQIRSRKKVYLIDNALAGYLGFRFSEDYGRLLENLVFLELKRRKSEIFYFQENNECDFIIREGIKVKEAIQTCYHLTKDNKEREINGLSEAMNKFKLKEGIILTCEQEDELIVDNKKIIIKPVWKWLLRK